MICSNVFTNKGKCTWKQTENMSTIALIQNIQLRRTSIPTFVRPWGTSKGPYSEWSNNIAWNADPWYLKCFKTHWCDSSTGFGSIISRFSLEWKFPPYLSRNICTSWVPQQLLIWNSKNAPLCYTWQMMFLLNLDFARLISASEKVSL